MPSKLHHVVKTEHGYYRGCGIFMIYTGESEEETRARMQASGVVPGAPCDDAYLRSTGNRDGRYLHGLEVTTLGKTARHDSLMRAEHVASVVRAHGFQAMVEPVPAKVPTRKQILKELPNELCQVATRLDADESALLTTLREMENEGVVRCTASGTTTYWVLTDAGKAATTPASSPFSDGPMARVLRLMIANPLPVPQTEIVEIMANGRSARNIQLSASLYDRPHMWERRKLNTGRINWFWVGGTREDYLRKLPVRELDAGSAWLEEKILDGDETENWMAWVAALKNL